jgi:hypothetical protein
MTVGENYGYGKDAVAGHEVLEGRPRSSWMTFGWSSSALIIAASHAVRRFAPPALQLSDASDPRAAVAPLLEHPRDTGPALVALP